ncbi:MAG: glycosyl hydrolase 108 family protein [Lutibacter sp.]|jgi:lysozyme family protein
MGNYNTALQKLLDNEGIYDNDPMDSGKETAMGISRKNFPNLKLWVFVDALKTRTDFPDCISWDKQILDLVNNFYRENFWDKIWGDKILDQNKAFSLFDFAVNAGVNTSVKIAQRALNLHDDGIIGTITLSAINNAHTGEFLAKFAIEKIEHYTNIVDKKPEQIKFYKGWVKRAIKNA